MHANVGLDFKIRLSDFSFVPCHKQWATSNIVTSHSNKFPSNHSNSEIHCVILDTLPIQIQNICLKFNGMLPK